MAHGNGLETSEDDAARQSQKYQLAFEQSRDAIMFFEGERFQDCNSATLAMFGVPDVATFVNVHPADLSPPYQPDGRPSRKAATDRLDEALSQGQTCFEWRHRTWDGVDFPTEVLLNRVDLEEGPLVQALVRDISDHKEAEPLRSRESVMAAVHPDDRARVQSAPETLLNGKPHELEHRIMRPDGEGTFLRDISERRDLEDELRCGDGRRAGSPRTLWH